MLNSQERRHLMRCMEDQPLVQKAIVARCAAALGVVVLIAALGAAGPDSRGGNASPDARIPERPPAAGSVDAHRREIFEQRRQRFAGGDPGVLQTEASPEKIAVVPK